jgi:hypothetical protein
VRARTILFAEVLLVAELAACRGPNAPASGEVLEENDFLVGDDVLRDKPVEAPLGSLRRTVDSGGFYAVGDAVEFFTKYAWRSRAAHDGDLVSGATVACFLSKAGTIAGCGTEVQRGPRTRAEAFTRQWVIATLREAPVRGNVVVGGCTCEASGVRVVLP